MAFPKIEGYVVTEKLGSGSYSTVYKAYTKVGARTTVAVKCVDKASIKHSGTAVDNLVTEIRMLKTLRHPHIVHMHNFTWDEKNIYIIMEYCCGGDLSKYIRRYGRIPENKVLYFLQQLASALKFLREKGVVHMDLKPHNLLLHKNSDGKYILKVADFGFASHVVAAGAPRGSPLYMAPEMARGTPTDRVDLWSVGVIMYECLFGRAPYSSTSLKELMKKLMDHAPIMLPPSASISPGCLALLARLLRHDPNQRISYEEFFLDPYLDLDNMPTKETYEKAVSLLCDAVSLDRSGRYRTAVRQYSAGAALLLPHARAETDHDRQRALHCKIQGYIARAEELKEQLKRANQPPPAVTSQDTMTSQGTEEHEQMEVCDLTNEEEGRASEESASASETEHREVSAIEELPAPPEQNSPSPVGTKSRLRRLFSRETKHENDSSKPNQDQASDGCRIT